MMNLLIYKLDNDINEKPVCILKEGEYFIGRGELLQCTDKRASRTHATIKITANNATITSTHQNPCFFQASNSKTIVILTKDVPADLSDGDKFGIFADQYWFNVKVQKNLDNNEYLEVKERATSHKRALHEDKNLEKNKFPKVDDRSKIYDMCKRNMKEILSSSDDENDSKQKQNVQENLKEMLSSSDEDTNLEKNKFLKVDDSFKYDICENNINKMLSSSDDEDDATQEQDMQRSVKEILSSSDDEHDAEQKLQGAQDDIKETNSNLSNGNNRTHKQELQNEDKTNSETTNDNKGKLTSANTDVDKSTKDNVELGCTENNIEQIGDTEMQPISTSPCISPAVNELDSELNTTELAVDQPSSSGNAGGPSTGDQDGSKVSRDKCWYGRQCYRKNLDHRKEFSHPGDSDYESDANDKRPVCSYGARCYRKNKDHRKEYRHPRRNRKKPQLPKHNLSSEDDDYDYDDPFLTDGTEDEYSEESWSDSDDDWSDSNANNDDEDDTKSLLKEAKRFTKQKK